MTELKGPVTVTGDMSVELLNRNAHINPKQA